MVLSLNGEKAAQTWKPFENQEETKPFTSISLRKGKNLFVEREIESPYPERETVVKALRTKIIK